MTKKFYVYKVFLKDEVIYVGKGQGSRCSHVLSGRSHNAKLNEYYYRHTLLGDECPVVKKVKYFEEDESALKYESYLIRDLLPDCNIHGKPKGITDQKDNSPSDMIYNPIPEDYDDFKIYIEMLFEDYLSNSVSESPHPLKWFLYGKLSVKSYAPYQDYINKFIKEIVENENLDLGGRPRKFPVKDLTNSEKSKFYRRFTSKGIDINLQSEKGREIFFMWLEYIRSGGKNSKFCY